jgi:hypothetical protein
MIPAEGEPMRVSELRAMLAEAPGDAIVQLHVGCRVEADGAVVMHGTPARWVGVDTELPAVGAVLSIEG